MFDVTKISCAPRDVLIFSVDMDLYDIEECRGIYEAILQQAPDMKIIFVPDDLVKEIIQVNRTIPMYYNNTQLEYQYCTIYNDRYVSLDEVKRFDNKSTTPPISILTEMKNKGKN